MCAVAAYMHAHEGAKRRLENVCMSHLIYKLHLTFWVNI